MEIAKRHDEGKWDARSQRGEAIELTLDMLNDNERAVLDTLNRDGEPMKIAEIMLANQWHIPDKAKGNSRVRNSVRKLIRGRWITHTKNFGDGRYQITDLGRGALGPRCNPVELSHAKAVAMRFDMSSSSVIKKADCAFYNACLEQAVAGDWSGFSCGSCNAYEELPPLQKQADMIRLRAMQMAVEHIEKLGNAGRVRGVKPGADAKRTVKTEETVPLSVALRVVD